MPDSGDARVASEFLMQLLADREEGRSRSLADYLARFPGHEATIAREYVGQLAGAATADAATASRSEGDASTIGPYRLVRELGRGGQGVVHLAEDSRMGRRVAVKVLQPRAPGDLSEALRRFQREAATAARLDHPDICTVHDVGADRDRVYLAMRYVEGVSLATCLAQAREPSPGDSGAEGNRKLIDALGAADARKIDAVLALVERTARALHAAHEAGVVHRDVKPGNVMITPRGDPVILDFGLARPEDPAAPALTRTGDVLGTPAYMSPEQLAGNPAAIDRRTDVWSLGVVLFECLTLRRPFEGPVDFALAEAIRQAPVPSPAQFNRAASRDVCVVVATALERDLSRRYATALALAEDLRRIREHQPISARPAGPMLHLRRWVRRSPMVAALLALVLVSLAGGLIASLVLLGQRGSALTAVMRLSDSAQLDRLAEREASLWPIGPGIVAGCDAWLADAGRVLDNRGLHEEALAGLRARARPGPLDTAADDRRAALERIASGEITPRHGAPPKWSERFQARRELAARNARAGWIWPDEPTAWMAEVLSGVVASYTDLESLAHEIADRRSRSDTLVRRSLEDEDKAWQGAIAAIAKAAPYRGLVLVPQRGLVPLRADDRSGLWEFWAVETGTRPRWDDDRGTWRIGPSEGAVLVLVPGGEGAMGSSIGDENPDPLGEENEGPITRVRLDPYFISKYELTQGQWMRLSAGPNPAFFNPAADNSTTPAHPVESVSFDACMDMLRRVGLVLPTEAQWEHGCRAGTTTPWFAGLDPGDLQGFANVADAGRFEGSDREIDDGWLYTAPVGSFRPNRFGLHDVHGNVWEWCLDPYERTFASPARIGDGLRSPPDDGKRPVRGGAFNRPAAFCRSAKRTRVTRSAAEHDLGVRPVRAVDATP